MAQIKIEITYDPSTETLEQAVSSLVPKTAIDPGALGEAVTQEALARLGKAAAVEGKPASKPEEKPQDNAGSQESSAAATDDKPEDTGKKVSKTDVRAIATALSKAGKREQLSAIFAEFGGKKLSDIKEEDYPALMEKLEAANG